MPTYEYKCKQCKHQFEAFQSITARPLTRCPKCRKNSLRRLIGAGAGIIFRGSGFYATDYRRGGKPQPSANDSAKDSSSDSSSNSSGDSDSKRSGSEPLKRDSDSSSS